MKKILVSVLAIAGLVACNNENVISEANNSQAITFGAFVENATRANDPSTTTNNIDEFSVWGYMNTDAGIVFNDELVSRSGSSWVYTNLQYWLPGNHYYFAAFAGDRNDVAGLPENAAMGAEGLGTITFHNVEGTNDILYAQTDIFADATATSINLQFAHLLSKVKFTFANGFANENTTVVVKDITMDVPAYGDLTLNKTAYDAKKYIGANHADTTTLEFGHMNNAAKLAIGTKESSDNERLTIPAGADKDYTIKFNVEVYNGEQCGLDRDMEVKLTGFEFVAGRAYNLVATISQENLHLNAIEFMVEVDEWIEQEVEYVFYDAVSNTAFANTADDLALIAQSIENGSIPSDATIVLEQDIDLSTFTRSVVSNWEPIGTSEKPFTGTFDGNGYTIKNLALVEAEAKEGKAYIGFFGYAKDATIKNVTFENVYINIPCLDIDHSQGHIGAVAGSLEGTSTIENVTVKGDIDIYTTQDANGASRVAVVAGGNAYGNVTMKNVHVIANAGSRLVANNNVGALAGQLQGKMVFENCSSNINVTANKFFAGGLVGIAAGDSYIKNCHTTGDVAVVAGREGRHNDEYRVGGIAGGWADGKTKVFTLEGCSYTGNVSGKNSDGSVAEPLDYMGYVGRGYTLANCEGSKVIIDGMEFVQVGNAAPYGVYTINGCTPVATADELVAALEAKKDVIFMNDIKIEPASMSNAYGATGINVKNGQTIDGNGHTLNIKGAGGTWDSGINTTGGLIKNLTVTGSFRGIFINHTSTHSEKVVLENVTLTGVTYTISCDQGLYQTIEATNCKFYGWTSFAKTAGEAKFVNCNFGEGSGYKYCRPYSNTEFVGCTFCPGYAVDTTRATVTFTDCTWEE